MPYVNSVASKGSAQSDRLHCPLLCTIGCHWPISGQCSSWSDCGYAGWSGAALSAYGIWTIFCTMWLICHALLSFTHICLFPTESDVDHHCGGLRQNWNIRAYRSRTVGLQLDWYWAAPLERHVGQPSAPHRPMAHAPGSAREELDDRLVLASFCKIFRYQPMT